MKKKEIEIVDKLRQTSRCRPEVAKTAEFFSNFSVDRYEDTARLLIDLGEDKATGILLCVSAVNKMKLSPDLLAETLKIVEPITDFSFPYKIQGEDAIEPLLGAAQAEDISWERQAFAGRIAAELALRCASDRQPVKKVLQKLSNTIRAPEINWIIDQTLALLDNEENDALPLVLDTQRDVLEELPEEKPPVIIGGYYTVRRPIPKIGRNAPCHCGSGKKYKKCCYEKDQQVLHDASPHEGITMTQLRAKPSLVDDDEMIRDMRAYELKKLQPAELNEDQLLAAYQRADTFGLRELAFGMLLELKRRPEKNQFAVEHMEDLLRSALDANDLQLARNIKQHIPNAMLHDAEAIQFHFDLLENQHHFTALEARCKEGLLYDDDSFLWNDPLLDLGYNFENLFPALSIVFSRAAIIGRPDHFLDNEFLLEAIRNARTELELDPWSDPIEDFFDWAHKKKEFDQKNDVKNKQIEELKARVSEANRLAAQKQDELKEKEFKLNRLVKKLEGAEKSTASQQNAVRSATQLSANERKTASDLRRQIDNLKAEINMQQHDRRQLRKQLQGVQKKLRVREFRKPLKAPTNEQSDGLEFETAPKKILIPEFTPAFRRSCESMPVPVVAKALRAAAGFATHDKSIWRRTKQIETIARVFRTQIGLRHRLLIGWEPEVRLEILDLIHRGQLETWIKRHAG